MGNEEQNSLTNRQGKREAAQYGEWQPIETAPRDGTAVLAFWNPLKGGDQTPCYGVVRCTDGRWHYDDEYDDEDWATPSYWMPLPDPPVTSARNGDLARNASE